MTPEEAIQFGKEQLEIFGKDSDMYAFIDIAIKALEERPKGRWIETGYETGALGITYQQTQCSNCGWEYALPTWLYFCPNCGADMRGDL